MDETPKRGHRTRVRQNAVRLARTPLARALYAKRSDYKLTLRQAARQVGVSQPTLFRLETRAALPEMAVAVKASRWLGVSLDDLFGRRNGR